MFKSMPLIIVKADARYFVRQGWEKAEILGRLNHWFSGGEDKELGKKVVSWYLCDAQWIKETLPSVLRRFWYIAPAVYLVAWYIREMALREAKRISSSDYSWSSETL